MAHKKLLFATGEGIGNVLQTIPVIRTLKEVLGYEIDFWHAFGSFRMPKIIPYVDKWLVGSDIMHIKPDDYVGKVSTFWTTHQITAPPVGSIKLLNEIRPLTMHRSEVDIYMDIARDLGAEEKDLIWYGACDYTDTTYETDVVIHNGYNPHGSANWRIKSYPYYKEVSKLLGRQELKVTSVGQKSEYIRTTYSCTDRPLLESLGIISKAKVFLGNDSGLYHAANALGVPNVVVFTATSIEKNYDSRFHKYTTIVGRDDLECRPCQAGRRWNKDCEAWDCQQVDPQVVYEAVMEKIQ